MPSTRGDEEVGKMGPKARAPKAVETMTEYEMEREARLAKNREVLHRLGVPEIVAATRIAADDDVDDDDEARRRRERERKRKARARDAGGGEPARRSTRASTVATRTGRFYVGKGEAGDDDDDSFDGSEDEEDADGSTDDDDDDDDDDAVEPVVAVKAKATRRKPARNPERPATAASLYRLPNPATLGRLAPYATDGAMNANFRRRSAFALPAAVNPKPLTLDPRDRAPFASGPVTAPAATSPPPRRREPARTTTTISNATTAAEKASEKARAKGREKGREKAPPPTPADFAEDVAAAFRSIQPAANRVAMRRGHVTIDRVTIGRRELLDACRAHGFYEWSEGDVARMMAVAAEAVAAGAPAMGREVGGGSAEARLTLDDFVRVAEHVGARRAEV